jgi:hypothetical protein
VSIFFKTAYPHSLPVILCDYFPQSLLVGAVALLVGFGSGCSSSSVPVLLEDGQLSPLDDLLLDPVLPPQNVGSVTISVPITAPVALRDLQSSLTLVSPVPVITSTEVLAESGLQVAYTQNSQSALAPALGVEANWLHMQSCLGQVGVAPLVLVITSAIAPLTAEDDVIFTIDGIPVASASMGSIPVIQIVFSDFLISGGPSGQFLRSIMGRVLWSSAGLSARDYPYSCARQLVESE